jgi:REP element-mobilizing transposase RayT
MLQSKFISTRISIDNRVKLHHKKTNNILTSRPSVTKYQSMRTYLCQKRSSYAKVKRGLHPSACGGSLRNFRAGRVARSISVKFSMHVVLRSLLARGQWSFVRRGTRQLIQEILDKHAGKSGVELISSGNAGNHLHLRIRVKSKSQYFQFVRAICGEIALKIKRLPRKDLGARELEGLIKTNFWASRPFTAIVSTMNYARRLVDYILVNQMEGGGVSRESARKAVKLWREGKHQLFES